MKLGNIKDLNKKKMLSEEIVHLTSFKTPIF